jgi:hypothetical protein
MKLSDFLFFIDENIDPLLVAFLREKGFDVFDTKENNLQWLFRCFFIRISNEKQESCHNFR